MAEGHIEFTQSMCVCLCVCVCVCFPELCPDHNLTIHDGIENNLAQMIIMTRRCVANKNHVARSKVMVTVRNYTLCINLSETC